jgi:hypothetical protein
MKKHSVLVTLLIMLMCVSLVFTGCQQAGGDGEKGENTTTTGTTDTTGGENNKPEDNGPQFEDPNDQVVDAIDKTMSALVSAEGVGSVLADAINGGKITIEAAGMIENVLYLNAADGNVVDILTMDMGGEKVEFGAYLQDSKLAVSAPMLFGDEVYGVDFKTLLTDLKDAEIWEMMGTSYDEFKEMAGINLDAALDMLEKYMETMPDGQAVIDCLKDVEVTREEGTVTINGESVKAVNVKYHVTSEDVLALLNATMDESEKSMKAMKDAFAEVLTDVDLDELMAEMDFDTIRQEMNDAFATVDLEGDLVISIDPETQYIMSVSMDIAGTVDGEEGKIDMDLVLGVDPTNTDKITFAIYGDANGERTGYTMEAVRTINGSVEKLTVTFNEVYDDETDTVATVEMSYDSSNGAYKFVMTDEYETITIEGVYKVNADKFEFSVESVTTAYDDEEYTEELGLRLVVEKINKSDIPKMPAMKNILKLTADEWTDLITMFEGMFGGMAEPDDGYYEDDYYEDFGEPDYSFDEFAA